MYRVQNTEIIVIVILYRVHRVLYVVEPIPQPNIQVQENLCLDLATDMKSIYNWLLTSSHKWLLTSSHNWPRIISYKEPKLAKDKLQHLVKDKYSQLAKDR